MKRLVSLLFLGALLLNTGCFVRDIRWTPIRPPVHVTPRTYAIETTGYCTCQECCDWEYNWLLQPVHATGPRKGKPKAVGITASGERARKGTIAADTSKFPFGTVMYVPGYGYGRVEDRGGAIKGYRIDLYFPSHSQARKWGRIKKNVKVWPVPR